VEAEEECERQKEDKTMNIKLEQDATEFRLNQLEIARQSLEEKDRRIWELLKKVELLESMLNRVAAQRYNQPQPQPLPAIRTQQRRWSVR
jgi:hypothetical protein